MLARITRMGYASCDGIKAHDHRGTPFHEFHFFIDGQGAFRNGALMSAVKPGAMFLSGPDDQHSAEVQGGRGPLLFYWLMFEFGPGQESLGRALREAFGAEQVLNVGLGYRAIFEDIRRRQNQTGALVRHAADALLEVLLCDLCEIRNRGPRQDGSNRYVEAALGLMHTSLHQDLSLDSLAEHLGLDKAYFVRLFKRHMGEPPMHYYLGLRIDGAKHRLLNGGETLKTIARDFGFHDEFHFSKQFKMVTGLSPQAWRDRAG